MTLCLFFIISFLSPQPSLAKTEDGKKVAVIGSSTYVAGCGKSWGFVQRLRKSLPDYTFTCFVKSGSGHDWFLQQFNDNVKGKGYNELIIYSGLNSLGSASSLEKSKESFKQILQPAELEGIRVIVTGAQPFANYKTWTKLWGNNLKENSDWLSTKPYGVDVFVDIYPYINDGAQGLQTIYNSGDGLHMNSDGHQLLHQLIMRLAYDATINVPDLPITEGSVITVKDLSIFGDIELILQKPQPKINIPGLDFSDADKLTSRADEDGNVFILIPYLGEYLATIYRYGVAIMSIIAVVMIINSGFTWVISGGNSEKISEAKKVLVNAITGLILVVGSYTLLYTINPNLVKFKNLKILSITGQPLEAYDKGDDKTPVSTGTPKKFADTSYDEIFQKYAPCVGVDWQILKIISFYESKLNPGVINKTGFTGLFQTKEKFCKTSLNRPQYDVDYETACKNLTNPEVSTMVGASMLRSSIIKIQKQCPTIDSTSAIYFMYIGHHNGQRALEKILEHTCDVDKAKEASYNFWTIYDGGKYADSKPIKRNATVISTEGDNTAKKVMALAISVGVDRNISEENKTVCPLINKSLQSIK